MVSFEGDWWWQLITCKISRQRVRIYIRSNTCYPGGRVMPTRSRTLKRDMNNHFDTTFDIRSALKKLWTRISNVTAATVTLILSSASYPSAFLFGNFPHGSYSQNSCQRRFRTSFTTLRLSHSRSDARERITQAIRPSSLLKGPSRRVWFRISSSRVLVNPSS